MVLLKVLRTRGWGWPPCTVNLLIYQLVLVKGVNYLARFAEGLEAGIQRSSAKHTAIVATTREAWEPPKGP